MAISGSVPAHSLYGSPVYGDQYSLAHGMNAEMAPPSGPYIGRGNKCSANDDTCEGNKVRGQELCAGHLRSVNKNAKSED